LPLTIAKQNGDLDIQDMPYSQRYLDTMEQTKKKIKLLDDVKIV